MGLGTRGKGWVLPAAGGAGRGGAGIARRWVAIAYLIASDDWWLGAWRCAWGILRSSLE